MNEAWFPRPSEAADVEAVAHTDRGVAEKLFALLSDPTAIEWRGKVGVVGRNDGSGKATTRLLAAQGHVIKTRLDLLSASREELRRTLLAARARDAALDLWHGSRRWGILRTTGGYLPLSLCVELATLRQLGTPTERLAAWIEMTVLGVRVHAEHGIGLDLNPSNFGRAPGDARLYYIDDEVYDTLSERAVAQALVARIVEEPEIDPQTWQKWGQSAASALRAEAEALSLDAIIDACRDYPVTEIHERNRGAFLDGMSSGNLHGKKRTLTVRSERRRTCVLADVHGNLAALDTVLEQARSHGVTDYLFLGDAVGYGPNPAECVQRLAELEPAVLLRGNHDHAIAHGQFDLGMNRLARQCAEWTHSVLSASELGWLAALPVEHAEDAWAAVHGAPRDPRKFMAYVYDLTYEDNLRYLDQEKLRFCFYGHTHVPMVHTLGTRPNAKPILQSLKVNVKGPILINPGSVGQPRDQDPRAAYAIWDRQLEMVAFFRVPYALEHTIRDIRSRDLPRELEHRLSVGA